MKQYPAEHATLQAILDEVGQGHTIQLTRQGQPVALVSPLDPTPSRFWEALERFRQTADLTLFEPSPFDDVRDPAPAPDSSSPSHVPRR